MKKTNSTTRDFQVYKDGFELYGRNYNGTCINITDSAEKPLINSNFDKPLLFKQDSLYACYRNMTFSDFYNFCINKKWKDLLVFNIVKDINLLGKFGASEIDYKSVGI